MKNQPERLADRADHIVAAGGQDITELCECEAERAAILEHDGGMQREDAEAMVLRWRGQGIPPDVKPCEGCPRVPKP